MNKKAIFMPTLALATIFLLTYAFFVFIVKDNGLNNQSTLGNNQVALTDAYKEAENNLFYNQEVIKYSVDQATEEFSNNGGVKFSCNEKWLFGDVNCDPKLEENFKIILKEKLTNHNLELQDFSINNNIANIKLKDKIYNETLKNFEFKYTVKQEFKQELPIDFDKLNKIKDGLLKCTASNNKISTCTQEKYQKIENNLIYFTIENNKNILSLTPSSGFKKLDFKFEIDNNNPEKNKF